MAETSFIRLTRRGLLAAGLIAPGLAWAQSITPALPVTSPDNETATLAARRDAADHMTAEVFINGAGPYHFIIDTGAEQTVLADDIAAALQLPPGKSVLVKGISGSLRAQTASLQELKLGPFKRRRLSAPVLPRALLIADGYLGLDVINGSRVTFDFTHRTLRVERPYARGNILPQQDTTSVQAFGKTGHLRIANCSIDGVYATTFIDSGAEVSVGNPALGAALKARNKRLPDLGTIGLSGVTGGEVLGQVVPVSRISMEKLTFTDCRLAIADLPIFETWDLREKPALLIGMNFLRQFATVTIDYRDQEIRFELSLAPPHPTPGVSVEAA